MRQCSDLAVNAMLGSCTVILLLILWDNIVLPFYCVVFSRNYLKKGKMGYYSYFYSSRYTKNEKTSFEKSQKPVNLTQQYECSGY